MLGWLRDKIYKRPSSESRPSTCTSSEIPCKIIDSVSNNLIYSTMDAEDANRITLHIIYQGEIWVVYIDRHKVISDLLKMAIGHFLDLTDVFNQEESVSKYKFLSVSNKKVLGLQCSLGDEELNNYDEILLVERISMESSAPAKLTLQDIKGPTIPEIFAATANIPRKNTIQIVPSLDCQESFQTEIRKVLYSLVIASAKVLAQSPDAKMIFSGIAARIDARYNKEIDKNAIKYLKDLGFTEAQARYALRLKRNRQVEAMEWLLENSHRVKDVADAEESRSDADLATDDPVAIIERLLRHIRDFHRRHFEPSTRALDALTAMGFGQDEIVEALQITNNNQVAACEWLCGERDESITDPSPGLDVDGPLYKALMNNAAIQLGLYNPKILLAFLSILDNPVSANLWLNDVDTAPVLGQVFKTNHSEKHIMVVNQQLYRPCLSSSELDSLIPAFLSILDNPVSANLWLNDVDTAPVLGQVFKTYHLEKHIIVVNQQLYRPCLSSSELDSLIPAFLSILDNPVSANLWLNDVDTAPVLGQVFKTNHSEKHIMVVNQQLYRPCLSSSELDSLVPAFLSILDNPVSANLWLNDVDTAPVLGQVFKTYHSEKHIMVVNQQLYRPCLSSSELDSLVPAFLSILDNPVSANLWLNDVDTAPVLGQVFKTYHSEKHIMVVNQQLYRPCLSSSELDSLVPAFLSILDNPVSANLWLNDVDTAPVLGQVFKTNHSEKHIMVVNQQLYRPCLSSSELDSLVPAFLSILDNPVSSNLWLNDVDTAPVLGQVFKTYHSEKHIIVVNQQLYQPCLSSSELDSLVPAFLSILDNPVSANLWLNDVDTAPVLGQVFKTYHSEKHIMVVNQQLELMRRTNAT